MATENGTNSTNGTTAQPENPATAVAAATENQTIVADPKGKGKAVATADDLPPQDTAMDEDEDDDDEEEDGEEGADAGDDDEDGLEAIDLDNIVAGRTRGKIIDFAKAAEENPPDEDDDEDDDDDFNGEDDDKMDED